MHLYGPGSSLRLLAYALLALVLLVRAGPLCETSATAAPMTMEMAKGECHGAPSAPKHPAASSCVVGCAALPIKPAPTVSSASANALDVVAAPARVLDGLARGPAPPPPRS